jgi:hypothetical protein
MTGIKRLLVQLSLVSRLNIKKNLANSVEDINASIS